MLSVSITIKPIQLELLMGAAGLIFFYFGVNIIISLCTEYAICVEDIYQPLHTPCDYLGEILKNKKKKK